jgi:phage protein D
MDLPFAASTQAVPAMRRPVFSVTLGAPAGGDDGGLLGDVAAAVGLTPAAEDPWARSLERLSVRAGVAPFVDDAELIVAADSQAPPVATGDSGCLSVGFEDEGAQLIFTGAVESLVRGLHGRTRVRVANGAATLAALRINQSYEQRSAGEVVQDLAQQAGLQTDAVEDGVDLPLYVVDDRRSAWDHVFALARRCGHLAFFTPGGKLSFAPPQEGDPVQTLNYGDDIIALVTSEDVAVVDSVRIVGEGAAGSEGADAGSWLVKDPASVSASGGGGTRERLRSDRSLRSSDAVSAAAQGGALLAGLRATTGQLLTAGAPHITVGSTIAIAGAPQEALNGNCIVSGVHHVYGKRTGFVTRVAFWKVGEGGLDALSGLAALGSAPGGLL